ncbi:unnamed protein product [Effrenium voratum]|nr:unnamed protein product [Effrenium voratum]
MTYEFRRFRPCEPGRSSALAGAKDPATCREPQCRSQRSLLASAALSTAMRRWLLLLLALARGDGQGQGLALEDLEEPGDSDPSRLALGGVMKMDHLGPVIVNEDGSMRRIANWNEMTQQEQLLGAETSQLFPAAIQHG